jgi:acetolactate decarboxylase
MVYHSKVKYMTYKIRQLQKKAVLLAGCILLSMDGMAQTKSPAVNIIGEMRKTMWQGQLQGKIYLDTLKSQSNLYGLGPLEKLAGEIIIIDGKAFVSKVLSNSTMKVEETYEAKAPFFGYTHVKKWKELAIPENIQSVAQLEKYLSGLSFLPDSPFIFKLAGTVSLAKLHVVNLPEGQTVKSPEDAHKGEQSYELHNEKIEIVGFYSTRHQSVFTHHDTFLHMHLINQSKNMMGHVDDIKIQKNNVVLFLPVE